ncbi:DUF4391 domain-containing protein [Streptococcus moroccensis]|uniref:DUF4391 domain-containing protein n=1 Tax=Streptococcus moroccensis TaxID=1451356 RepID=A0ABT9YPZ0_9STRE|nr:DUF4391 domain-containing protein [Streptococcus moroccensis]MDQ0221661.1 hypothetical protein [Streptococcus moroccensis]
MIHLPQSSQLPKPYVLYKAHRKGNSDFFDELALSSKDKQELRRTVEQIVITHQLDPQTTNIPAGERVQQLFVIECLLKEGAFDHKLFERFDEHFAGYAMFCLRCPGYDSQHLIHYKEPLAKVKGNQKFKIIRRFLSKEPLKISLKGQNLDQFYSDLVKEVASEPLLPPKTDIKEALAFSDALHALEKEAELLKKKMYREKSMRKQLDYKRLYQQKRDEIKALKKPLE